MNYVTDFSSVLHIGKWDRGGKWGRAAWNTFKGALAWTCTRTYISWYSAYASRMHCARDSLVTYIGGITRARTYIRGEIRFVLNPASN